MADKKFSNNEKIACPFCGKHGTVMMSHNDMSVVHKREWRDVIVSVTGKTIKAEVLVDGCSNLGKMGILVDTEEEFEM